VELLEDDEDVDNTNDDDNSELKNVDGRPAWMRTLHTSVKTWLDLVPKVNLHYVVLTLFLNIYCQLNALLWSVVLDTVNLL